MTFWLPIIVATLTIFGGGLLYSYQKKIDRRVSLIERRRECYSKFLVSLSTELMERNKQSFMEVQKLRAEIFIIGSDEVVKAVGVFSSRSSVNKIARMKKAVKHSYRLTQKWCGPCAMIASKGQI